MYPGAKGLQQDVTAKHGCARRPAGLEDSPRIAGFAVELVWTTARVLAGGKRPAKRYGLTDNV